MFKVGNKIRYKLKQTPNKARFGQCAKVIDVQSNGDVLVRWDDGSFAQQLTPIIALFPTGEHFRRFLSYL